MEKNKALKQNMIQNLLRHSFSKFFFGLVFLLGLAIVPVYSATAQQCGEIHEGLPGGVMSFERSIVPCGRDCDEPDSYNDESRTCTLCHLLILLKNIMDLMFAWLFYAALTVITISGVIYMISVGRPDLRAVATKIIIWAIGGFFMFLLFWMIMYTFLVFISADENRLGVGRGSRWWEFNCEIESAFGDYDGGEPNPLPPPPTPNPGPPGPGTQPPDDTDYTYQPGIAEQVDDMSDELEDFLECMQNQLPEAAKVISSISDSAGMDRCVNNYARPPCAHSQYSCHYGGRNCRGRSYAVDFGNEGYHAEIYQAAMNCEPGAYVLNEGNHIHVSIGQVHGCGCY